MLGASANGTFTAPTQQHRHAAQHEAASFRIAMRRCKFFDNQN
jgi:hypothetical protein